MSEYQSKALSWAPKTDFWARPFWERFAPDFAINVPLSDQESASIQTLSRNSPQVLDTPVDEGYVLTNGGEFAGFFDTFAAAQAAATDGAYLEAFESELIGDIGAANITSDNMTFASQAGFAAVFTLSPGIISFTALFTGDVDIIGSVDDNVIVGNNVGNAVFGGAGDDTLTGGGGGDTVGGGEGNDTVRVIGVTGAANTYWGGIGTDRLFLDFEDYSGPAVTVTLHLVAGRIIGSDDPSPEFFDQFTGFNLYTVAGAEGVQFEVVGFAEGTTVVSGSETSDVISLLSGRAEIFGRGGADVLTGSESNDTIFGGGGFDTVFGNGGNDLIGLANGNDFGSGQDGTDTLFGGQGRDTLLGGNDGDALWGGTGDDISWGGAGGDTLGGASGSDTLGGGGGNDLIFGGANDDTLYGADGNDTLLGGLGNDGLFSGIGNDELFGDGGNDRIFASNGADTINAGDGDDTVGAGAGFDSVELGAGFDTVAVFKGDDTTTILDFNVDEDTLQFWKGLWDEFGPSFFMSTLDIVEEFGSVTETGVELDFGDGDIVVLDGVFSLSDVAFASEIVNLAPIAPVQEFTVVEDTLLTGALFPAAFDPDGDPLTLKFVSTFINEETNGTMSTNINGDFQYFPKLDFNGVDIWSYVVEDPFGAETTGTIRFTMTPVNDVPTAVDDVVMLAEDGFASGNVLTNDFDIDSQFLIVDVSGTQSTQLELFTLAGGFVRIDALGDFTYTAPKDFNGIDSIIYPITDLEGGPGGSGRGIGEIFFNISAVNDDPVAGTRRVQLREDTAFNGDLLVGASDVDGDTLTVIDVSTETESPGSLVYASSGLFTYTPSADLFGTVTYEVNISDGKGGTTTGTVIFDIAPETDDFTPVNGVTEVGEDGTRLLLNGESFQALTTDTLDAIDPDANRTFTYELIDGPDERLFQDFQLEEDGEFSFRIKEDSPNVTTIFDAMSSFEERTQTVYVFPIEEVDHTFTFRVTDQFGSSREGLQTINVIGKDNEVLNDRFIINETRFLSGDVQIQNPETGQLAAVTNFGNIFDNDHLTGSLRSLEFLSATRGENTDVVVTQIAWDTVPVPEIAGTSRGTFLITSEKGSLILDFAENGDVKTYNFGGDLLTSATSELRLKFEYTVNAIAGGADDLAGNAGSKEDYTATIEVVLEPENFNNYFTTIPATYFEFQVVAYSGSTPTLTPLDLLIHDFSATEPADIGDYIASGDFQQVQVTGQLEDPPDLGSGMADAYVGLFSWLF